VTLCLVFLGDAVSRASACASDCTSTSASSCASTSPRPGLESFSVPVDIGREEIQISMPCTFGTGADMRGLAGAEDAIVVKEEKNESDEGAKDEKCAKIEATSTDLRRVSASRIAQVAPEHLARALVKRVFSAESGECVYFIDDVLRIQLAEGNKKPRAVLGRVLFEFEHADSDYRHVCVQTIDVQGQGMWHMSGDVWAAPEYSIIGKGRAVSWCPCWCACLVVI